MVEISKQARDQCSLNTSGPSPNNHSQVFPRDLLGAGMGVVKISVLKSYPYILLKIK